VQGRGAVATRRQPGVDYYGDECDTGGEDTTATTVDTAIGPTATTELGPTLMHEHIVTRSPGVQENWPHLWDRAAILAIAERKLADLYSRGIRTIVDLTTVDLGRDIGLIADVARRSRVHVIVATGVWWMPQRYFSAHGVDAVADLFIRDIRQGIGESSIKAAIIKCATDTAGVTPVIENILRASARAQKATGVPISTHTWAAGRSGETQQAIFAQEGVDLSRVIIGHSGDSDDLSYLRGLMERGSTIGMDRFGLEHFLPTAKRVEVLARLCSEGYAPKMVLSHDANCWSDMLSEDDKRRTRPRWHYNHISDDILPALRQAGVSEDQIAQMLVRNPRAIFEARK
jgi:phosphotriesterase-related protein